MATRVSYVYAKWFILCDFKFSIVLLRNDVLVFGGFEGRFWVRLHGFAQLLAGNWAGLCVGFRIVVAAKDDHLQSLWWPNSNSDELVGSSALCLRQSRELKDPIALQNLPHFVLACVEHITIRNELVWNISSSKNGDERRADCYGSVVISALNELRVFKLHCLPAMIHSNFVALKSIDSFILVVLSTHDIYAIVKRHRWVALASTVHVRVGYPPIFLGVKSNDAPQADIIPVQTSAQDDCSLT